MGLAFGNEENLILQLLLLALLAVGIVYFTWKLAVRSSVVKHGKLYTARKVGFLYPYGQYVRFRFNWVRRTAVKPLYEFEAGDRTVCAKSFDTYHPSPPPFREDEQKNWVSPYVTRLYDDVYFYERWPSRVSVAGKKFVRRYVLCILVFCALIPGVLILPAVFPKAPAQPDYGLRDMTMEELVEQIEEDHALWERQHGGRNGQ